MTAHDTEDHLDWGPEQLRHALDAAGVAMWSWNVDTDVLVMDPMGYRLWDVSREGPLCFEDLSAKIHRPTVTA